jgi:hypothetical protein
LKISWFFLAPMPMLTAGNRALTDLLNGWHENFEWALSAFVQLCAITTASCSECCRRGSDIKVASDETGRRPLKKAAMPKEEESAPLPKT